MMMMTHKTIIHWPLSPYWLDYSANSTLVLSTIIGLLSEGKLGAAAFLIISAIGLGRYQKIEREKGGKNESGCGSILRAVLLCCNGRVLRNFQ